MSTTATPSGASSAPRDWARARRANLLIPYAEAAGSQRHVRALARELLRESGADARRGAGDEDDVAIEGGHQRAMRSMPTTRSASGVSRRAKAIRSPGRRPSKSAAEAAMKGI